MCSNLRGADDLCPLRPGVVGCGVRTQGGCYHVATGCQGPFWRPSTHPNPSTAQPQTKSALVRRPPRQLLQPWDTRCFPCTLSCEPG